MFSNSRSVFCDFGEQFPIIDTTGETPLQGMIVSIVCSLSDLEHPHLQAVNSPNVSSSFPHVQDEEGIVTTLDETRHGLEDGDYVTFTEIKGMEKLNSTDPRKITVKGKQTQYLSY